MKRSWTTLLLVAGLIGLLALLGGLQYRWLSRISESDGEKAHKRVKEQAERFAADFNREIQNSYFNFQTDAESWKKNDWTSFNERYDFWREKTAYPELISGFYFVPNDPKAGVLKYDRGTRTFAAAGPETELDTLRTRLLDDKQFKPVLDDSYTLVLPIHEAGRQVERILVRTSGPSEGPPAVNMPPRAGYLIIRLDPQIVKDKLLSDLTAKYFGDGEYRAAVTDAGGNTVFQSLNGAVVDASAPLLDLSPTNFIFYANRDLMKTIENEKRPGVVVSSRIESHTFERNSPNDNANTTLNIQVKRDTAPRTSIITATTKDGTATTPWTLQVQHSSGSLDAFIADSLRRNLAVGFGLIGLLAAAIGAIVVSAYRAKLFAQRQVDFVSSVSHEFRTPLAVICSAGENLADGVANESGQITRYGELIKGEGRKLSGMVEQILDFAGADSGRRKFNFAEISVGDLLNDALGEFRGELDAKGFAVDVSIPETLPSVMADKNALTQAFQNLIANSIKYSGETHWLGVKAENGNGVVKISVEDHGLGIDKRDLKHVFKPFYRAKDVVDSQIHGNGLGLSIVKQIAEAHGGRVTAESVKGSGSKFTIELPQSGSPN